MKFVIVKNGVGPTYASARSGGTGRLLPLSLPGPVKGRSEINSLTQKQAGESGLHWTALLTRTNANEKS